jgi:hypothetical protein
LVLGQLFTNTPFFEVAFLERVQKAFEEKKILIYSGGFAAHGMTLSAINKYA